MKRNEKERKEREKHQQASWNTPILSSTDDKYKYNFFPFTCQWVKNLRLSNYKIERAYQI